jgi:hypothetical protein
MVWNIHADSRTAKSFAIEEQCVELGKYSRSVKTKRRQAFRCR